MANLNYKIVYIVLIFVKKVKDNGKIKPSMIFDEAS